MPTMTSSAKKCVNCHKDVTNGKRMKDSSGRYWCVSCGTADQKKKAGASSPVAVKKQVHKGPGLIESLQGMFAGGGGTDKARLIKMLVVMGLLAAGAVWRFSTLHSG
jgi:hypothetical protein